MIIRAVWHDELADEQLTQLGRLFDAEYGTEDGPWNPDAPYGYAPAELHVVAVRDGQTVGHVGIQRRMISVGEHEVLVAGTGGVLVAPPHRASGLGARLLTAAQEATRRMAPAEYGYLGCREEVVPFYEFCGYTRRHLTERCHAHDGSGRVLETTGTPVMVCSGTRDKDTWPRGTVDLRGRPW